MLDHHHRISCVDQPLQLNQQPVRIRRVQAGGGFVQHVKRAPALAALQFSGQLDALGLAA